MKCFHHKEMVSMWDDLFISLTKLTHKLFLYHNIASYAINIYNHHLPSKIKFQNEAIIIAKLTSEGNFDHKKESTYLKEDKENTERDQKTQESRKWLVYISAITKILSIKTYKDPNAKADNFRWDKNRHQLMLLTKIWAWNLRDHM